MTEVDKMMNKFYLHIYKYVYMSNVAKKFIYAFVNMYIQWAMLYFLNKHSIYLITKEKKLIC